MGFEHKRVVEVLRMYLQVEFFSKHGTEKEFISTAIHPLLPQQGNLFDCGLFLMHYAERFIEVRIY